VLRRRAVPIALSACLLIGLLAGDLAWHDYTSTTRARKRARWSPPRHLPAAPAAAKFLLKRRAQEGPSRFAWLTDRNTRIHQLRYGRDEPQQSPAEHGRDALRADGRVGYDPVHLDSFSAYLRRSNNFVRARPPLRVGAHPRDRQAAPAGRPLLRRAARGTSRRTCRSVFRSKTR